MTTIAELESPLQFPDWVDAAQLVRPLLHSAITEQLCTPRGAAIRRDRTRESPLHFALVYLMDYFRDQRTGAVSFAEGHLDMFSRVGDWADRRGQHHYALVAPRKYGKSTIASFAGPAWALCHGHHTFYALFSNTVDLAVNNHLRRLIDLFSDNNPASRLLLNDYPHMAPLKGGGHKRTAFQGGATIAAGGVMGKSLGLVERNERPTLIGADDMLPGPAMTTEGNVTKVKQVLTTSVWPMNDEADLVVSGTVFARGDLADDIVRLATDKRPRSLDGDRGRWLTSRHFDCLYYRPIWAQRNWPAGLAELRELNPVDYALTYEPDLLDAVEQDTYFTDELFEARRWAAPYTVLTPPDVGRIFLTDHAVSGAAKAGDMTALSVWGFDGRRIFLEHAEQDHYDMDQLAERVWYLADALLRQGKTLAGELGWERNNGGVALAETFARLYGLPKGMKLVPFWCSANKAARIKDFFAQLAARKVFVPVEQPAFEAQAVAWKPGASGPGVDDMLDTASAAMRRFLYGKYDDNYLLKPNQG